MAHVDAEGLLAGLISAEIAQRVVVRELDPVLERLMPALNLALGYWI